jgi:6-phosphogluconolactonase/glucosamine-6-phosphate isomerase/deaminase
VQIGQDKELLLRETRDACLGGMGVESHLGLCQPLAQRLGIDREY